MKRGGHPSPFHPFLPNILLIDRIWLTSQYAAGKLANTLWIMWFHHPNRFTVFVQVYQKVWAPKIYQFQKEFPKVWQKDKGQTIPPSLESHRLWACQVSPFFAAVFQLLRRIRMRLAYLGERLVVKTLDPMLKYGPWGNVDRVWSACLGFNQLIYCMNQYRMHKVYVKGVKGDLIYKPRSVTQPWAQLELCSIMFVLSLQSWLCWVVVGVPLEWRNSQNERKFHWTLSVAERVRFLP